jgi:DNA-binding response OmpR family regulator
MPIPGEKYLESVIIVETDSAAEMAATYYLKDFGAKSVTIFKNGNDALEALLQNPTQLILMNWSLENPSGIDIYEKVRENPTLESVPLIFLSQTITKEDLTLSQHDLKCKFIAKPIEEGVLLETVNQILGLAINKNHDSPSAELASPTPQPNGSSLSPELLAEYLDSVVIVTPEDALAEILVAYATKYGAKKTRIFKSSQDGIADLKANPKQLLMFDWNLESPGGLEVYESLRSEPTYEELPVIFLSKALSKDDITLSAQDQRVKFIIKTFDEEMFVAALNGVLSQSFRVIKDKGNSLIKGEGTVSGKDLYLDKGKVITGEDFVDKGKVATGSLYVDKKSSVKTPKGLSESIKKRLKQLKVEPAVPKSALVADADSTILNMMKGYLQQIGVGTIETHVNGKEAWQAAQTREFDVIIMDWKLPGMNGLSLYNRIRTHERLATTPVLVMSGFVEQTTFRILEESIFTKFLRKPFVSELFAEALTNLLGSISTSAQIAATVHSALETITASESLALEFVHEIEKAFPKNFQIVFETGKCLAELNLFGAAERAFSTALRLDVTSMSTVTELAKIYHLTSAPEKAIKLLTHADNFSPGNIERLCLMGEVGLNLGNTKGAREYFKKVLEIDSDNIKAKAGVTVSENILEQGETLNAGGKTLNVKLASTLNIIGITYIKNKQFKKGLEQYHAAMCFVHDPATIAQLQFNMGLAYVKSGDKVSAAKWCKEAEKNSQGTMTKLSKYLDQPASALEEASFGESASNSDTKSKTKPTEGGGLTYNWKKAR